MEYEKKHKEEVVRATQLWECGDITRENLEYIFPELKESEDERMRNIAINACKYMVDNFENSTKQYEDAITWLEKQGKHKDYYTKKELIDIGFSFTLNGDIVTPDKMMEDMKKYLAWLEKQCEQKPKWTEEDSLMIDSIIDTMKWLEGKGATNMKIDWLKSIKQRMGGEE